jgi:hypothetical protein
MYRTGNVCKYSIGDFKNYKAAKEFKENFAEKYNMHDIFITPYFEGKRVPFKLIEQLLQENNEQ